MNVISFQTVSKIYKGEAQPAVRHVTFSVAEKEFVCFIGASGCGKSTVLKMIAGLEEPTSGAIEKPKRVSMCFQSGALFPWLSVFENVALGLRTRGVADAHVRQVVEQELDLMRLRDFSGKYPADLSGGQRQRVGIARAIAVKPEVLLLDEPFSALDPKTTAELHDDLIEIWHRTGTTIVLVSHLIEEAVSLGERVILMRDGTIDAEFPISLGYPRREQGAEFMRDVQNIRKAFFR